MLRLHAHHNGKTYEVLTRCQCPQKLDEAMSCMTSWAKSYPTVVFNLTDVPADKPLSYSDFYADFINDHPNLGVRM